jgi:hypothetical protein
MNSTLRALCLPALFLPAPLLAQSGLSGPSASPEINPFLDPAVQDYVETAYGYLNPEYTPGLINDFRDSPTSLYSAARTHPVPPAADKPQLRGEQRLKGSLSQAAGQAAVTAGNTAHTAARPAAGQHYKVTFAGESGPISSCVNPLDSGAMSGFKLGDYAFISVLPKTEDSSAVITALAADGFRLSGEKTYFTAERKKTFILGWVPHAKLDRIYKNPLVLRVAVEKKHSGAPFLTRVRFTLRAPGGESSAAFVADFIRNLGSSAGFSAENVFRLPKAAGGAKFTAFEITGSLPVDMVRSVSLSPFVAAMEFQDKSL